MYRHLINVFPMLMPLAMLIPLAMLMPLPMFMPLAMLMPLPMFMPLPKHVFIPTQFFSGYYISVMVHQFTASSFVLPVTGGNIYEDAKVSDMGNLQREPLQCAVLPQEGADE